MKPGFRLTAASALHKGDRDYQQDQLALLAHPRVAGCLLAVVADGMGGRSGGRKASDQVILTARQLFERYQPGRDEGPALLRQLAQESHMMIKLTAIAAEQEPHSTLAAFVVNPEGDCHWLHVGDSRIHHFRDGRLVHRTVDHSYVQALLSQGRITEQEAASHPQAHILVGSLGSDDDPPLQARTIAALRPGDVLLACSDGLWHYFSTAQLAEAVTTLPPREACRFLVDKARALARGGGDNLSLVVVRVEALVG